MPDPEIEFHRFFNPENLTQKQLQRLPGKLDLNSIDPKLAEALGGIKALFNEQFSQNSESIGTPSGRVTLHVDYIKKPHPPVMPRPDAVTHFESAISFTNSGFYFIGITYDMVLLMNDICSLLSRSSLTAELLGITADNPEKRQILFACLFLVQIQFVIDHELGHHVHGHTTRSTNGAFYSEYPCDGTSDGDDHLDDQAREVEADGYAIHMMAKNIFSSEKGANLVQRLGSTRLPEDEFLARFLLLCIASYFFLRPQQNFVAGGVRKPLHPFGLMRMNVVMTDFVGWPSEFKPSVVNLITQRTLSMVSQAIMAAQPDSDLIESWEQQRIFLQSEEGGAYKDDLYKHREVLRGQMKNNAWAVSSPGPEKPRSEPSNPAKN